MSITYEFKGTTKRGFPVIIRATVYPSEPDVGLMSRYLEDMEVLTTAGKDAGFLRLTQDDVDELEIQFWESLRDEERENDYYP